MGECSDCAPIRKERDELLREIRELERERDGVENQLHKADLRIGRLQAEVRELRAAKAKLEAPRFSPG